MTREEQIVGAAKAKQEETEFCELVKSPVSKGVDSAFGIGFLEGAVWADEHPKNPQLSAEEKARAYDRAIIKAKALYGQPLVDNTLLETIFPELAKSKDEKSNNK